MADSVACPTRFSLLYERHLRAVAGYLARRVGTELAEDLTAEVFVRAFRGRASFRPDHETALPWLLGIASHLVADHRRAERRRLAALQRIAGQSAYTGQDEVGVLGADLHIRSPLSPPGTIIPRLTRLVWTLPDARFYLVVTTWSPDSTWSPRLGDQVSIVTVRGRHAAGTVPIPAVDLTNANEVSLISPTDQQFPNTPGLYHVGIVPDGVARVRWTFANHQFQPGAVINAPASNNVAVSRGPLDTFPVPLRAAWYAADSHRIPTSNDALLASQGARDAAQKAQLIRTVLQHPYHADPSLLAAFAVFAITSSTGVKTAAGDIISRPPLAALPLDVLQGYARPGPPQLQLDFSEVRQVITPSGVHVYVIPGTRGLCLVSGDSSSPFPDGILAGGGGGSCNTLPGVETQGLTMTDGSLGIDRTYEILPKTIRSITIRNPLGTRTTIPVPDGIYVSPGRRTVNDRPCRAAGHTPGVPYRCLPRAR